MLSQCPSIVTLRRRVRLQPHHRVVQDLQRIGPQVETIEVEVHVFEHQHRAPHHLEIVVELVAVPPRPSRAVTVSGYVAFLVRRRPDRVRPVRRAERALPVRSTDRSAGRHRDPLPARSDSLSAPARGRTDSHVDWQPLNAGGRFGAGGGAALPRRGPSSDHLADHGRAAAAAARTPSRRDASRRGRRSPTGCWSDPMPPISAAWCSGCS